MKSQDPYLSSFNSKNSLLINFPVVLSMEGTLEVSNLCLFPSFPPQSRSKILSIQLNKYLSFHYIQETILGPEATGAQSHNPCLLVTFGLEGRWDVHTSNQIRMIMSNAHKRSQTRSTEKSLLETRPSKQVSWKRWLLSGAFEGWNSDGNSLGHSMEAEGSRKKWGIAETLGNEQWGDALPLHIIIIPIIVS